MLTYSVLRTNLQSRYTCSYHWPLRTLRPREGKEPIETHGYNDGGRVQIQGLGEPGLVLVVSHWAEEDKKVCLRPAASKKGQTFPLLA